MPEPAPSPDKIRFRCPQCEARLAAPRARAGAQIPCPKCSTLLTVPDGAGDADAARAEWSLARCPDCDEILKVKRASFGTPVRCPSCESDLIVDDRPQRGA